MGSGGKTVRYALRCETVGIKTRLMYREVAIWWMVGMRRGWREAVEGGSFWISTSSENASVGGVLGGLQSCSIDLVREARKSVRCWQIMRVVG